MITGDLSGPDIFLRGGRDLQFVYQYSRRAKRKKNKNALTLWFILIATTSNDLQQSASAWVGIGCELAIDIL